MPHQITSSANPLIKTLKSLHLKKGRAETGLFLAEGARLAREAADLGIWPETLLFAASAHDRAYVRAFVGEAEAHGVKIIETNETVLGAVAKRDNPQTVIGAYRQRLTPLHQFDPHLVVALHTVRDPGNLGTIIRTADAVGASGVVFVEECCDPFSVGAVRATMGSHFAVKLAQASFAELLAFKQASQAELWGASLNGVLRGEADPIPARIIAMMGNEQSGLSPEAEAACDVLLRLPMRGRADSLNLASATAVVLYDLWRRRGYDGAHA